MRKNFCFRAMASCVNTLKPGVKYNQKRKAFGLPLFHSRICRISQIARLYRVRGRGRRVLFGRVRFPSAPHAALRCVCSSAAPPCQRQNVLRRVQQKIRRRAVLHAAQKLLGTYQLEWQGEKLDLTPGWPRLPMHEAVKQYCGIDFMAITSDEEAVAAAKSIGVELPETADKTWGNALYECFDQKVEEKLVQPTFITMHPVDVSPLAKRSPKDPRLTERFELFICRSEMGNAFSELNDPIDQKARFQKQVEMREHGDEEAGMMDTDYITALEYGLPPTGGLGIGIDRCVMLLTGQDSVREVILFPTMKPIGGKDQ